MRLADVVTVAVDKVPGFHVKEVVNVSYSRIVFDAGKSADWHNRMTVGWIYRDHLELFEFTPNGKMDTIEYFLNIADPDCLDKIVALFIDKANNYNKYIR